MKNILIILILIIVIFVITSRSSNDDSEIMNENSKMTIELTRGDSTSTEIEGVTAVTYTGAAVAEGGVEMSEGGTPRHSGRSTTYIGIKFDLADGNSKEISIPQGESMEIALGDETYMASVSELGSDIATVDFSLEKK